MYSWQGLFFRILDCKTVAGKIKKSLLISMKLQSPLYSQHHFFNPQVYPDGSIITYQIIISIHWLYFYTFLLMML